MHAFGATRSHQAEMRAEMVVCGGLWMDVAVGLVLHKRTIMVGGCSGVQLDDVGPFEERSWPWQPSSGGGAASSSQGPRINPGAWSSALLPGRVLVGVVCRGAQPGDIRKGTNGTADVGTLEERDWTRARSCRWPRKGRSRDRPQVQVRLPIIGMLQVCGLVVPSAVCRLPSSKGWIPLKEKKIAVCKIGRGQFEHAPSAHDAKWSSRNGKE